MGMAMNHDHDNGMDLLIWSQLSVCSPTALDCDLPTHVFPTPTAEGKEESPSFPHSLPDFREP